MHRPASQADSHGGQTTAHGSTNPFDPGYFGDPFGSKGHSKGGTASSSGATPAEPPTGLHTQAQGEDGTPGVSYQSFDAQAKAEGKILDTLELATTGDDMGGMLREALVGRSGVHLLRAMSRIDAWDFDALAVDRFTGGRPLVPVLSGVFRYWTLSRRLHINAAVVTAAGRSIESLQPTTQGLLAGAALRIMGNQTMSPGSRWRGAGVLDTSRPLSQADTETLLPRWVRQSRAPALGQAATVGAPSAVPHTLSATASWHAGSGARSGLLGSASGGSGAFEGMAGARSHLRHQSAASRAGQDEVELALGSPQATWTHGSIAVAASRWPLAYHSAAKAADAVQATHLLIHGSEMRPLVVLFPLETAACFIAAACHSIPLASRRWPRFRSVAAAMASAGAAAHPGQASAGAGGVSGAASVPAIRRITTPVSLKRVPSIARVGLAAEGRALADSAKRSLSRRALRVVEATTRASSSRSPLAVEDEDAGAAHTQAGAASGAEPMPAGRSSSPPSPEATLPRSPHQAVADMFALQGRRKPTQSQLAARESRGPLAFIAALAADPPSDSSDFPVAAIASALRASGLTEALANCLDGSFTSHAEALAGKSLAAKGGDLEGLPVAGKPLGGGESLVGSFSAGPSGAREGPATVRRGAAASPASATTGQHRRSNLSRETSGTSPGRAPAAASATEDAKASDDSGSPKEAGTAPSSPPQRPIQRPRSGSAFPKVLDKLTHQHRAVNAGRASAGPAAGGAAMKVGGIARDKGGLAAKPCRGETLVRSVVRLLLNSGSRPATSVDAGGVRRHAKLLIRLAAIADAASDAVTAQEVAELRRHGGSGGPIVPAEGFTRSDSPTLEGEEEPTRNHGKSGATTPAVSGHLRLRKAMRKANAAATMASQKMSSRPQRHDADAGGGLMFGASWMQKDGAPDSGRSSRDPMYLSALGISVVSAAVPSAATPRAHAALKLLGKDPNGEESSAMATIRSGLAGVWGSASLADAPGVIARKARRRALWGGVLCLASTAEVTRPMAVGREWAARLAREMAAEGRVARSNGQAAPAYCDGAAPGVGEYQMRIRSEMAGPILREMLRLAPSLWPECVTNFEAGAKAWATMRKQRQAGAGPDSAAATALPGSRSGIVFGDVTSHGGRDLSSRRLAALSSEPRRESAAHDDPPDFIEETGGPTSALRDTSIRELLEGETSASVSGTTSSHSSQEADAAAAARALRLATAGTERSLRGSVVGRNLYAIADNDDEEEEEEAMEPAQESQSTDGGSTRGAGLGQGDDEAEDGLDDEERGGEVDGDDSPGFMVAT